MRVARIEQFRRKYSRLKSMDRDEVSFRARALLRANLQRIEHKLSRFAKSESRIPWAGGAKVSSLKSYLMDTCAPRFYLPTLPTERTGLRRLFDDEFPEWKNRAISEADRLCEHQVSLLGYGDVSLGQRIHWNRDPFTSAIWPQRFWDDYDLTADGLPGDPKSIHELGRCQHLPRLGKAYFLTGDEKYAEEALHQMLSWIDQNPTGFGIHWNSSLEISLRIISWLWTIFFILDSSELDEGSAKRLLISVAAQLEHVHRFLSEYSSPNTHLLGEATALYIGGSLFTEWEPAAQWRHVGKRILTREISNQFTYDGFHGELSTYYHCYALDFYLQAAILSIGNDHPWTSAWWGRIERMVDVVMSLARPEGSLPWLGDEDGGRALALESNNYKSTKDLLSTAAVLFGRPQFKHAAGRFCEETLWLLGSKAWWTFATMESRAPIQLQTIYQDSGLAIQRSDWGSDAKCLVFDFGSMDMFRGGHGHADALSIVLSISNEEMLVDPGTGIYNGASEWRNFFRSSRAHNTAIVDHCEQSEPGDTFSWTQTATAKMTRSIDGQAFSFVEAEHSGFSRLKQSVTHLRGVLFCRPDCWLIVDRFLGHGSHDIDFFYHFAADARVHLSEHWELDSDHEARVRARAGSAQLEMFFAGLSPIDREVITGQAGNIQGWSSNNYGQRLPSPCLKLGMHGSVPSLAVSLLLPSKIEKGDAVPRLAGVRQVSAKVGRAVAIESLDEDHQDLWIASFNEEEIEVLGFRMRGELLWIRTFPNNTKQLFALNTSYFDFEGLCPKARIDTFHSSICVAWNQNGQVVEQPNQAEDFLCVESAEL